MPALCTAVAAPARVECAVAVPDAGELVFGVEPSVPPERLAVVVQEDPADGPPETAVAAARAGEDWRVPLAAFAGGVVRVRIADRGGGALTLQRPRVVGNARRLPPLLDARARPPARPINVVLYVVDALRADRLSTYGYPYPTSPNLDRLAARGRLFMSAYSAGPNTTASVPSLLGSRYPWEHGGHLAADRDARPTLAELFRRAGYRTGGFQANFLLPAILGFGRGFDRYDVVFEKTASGPRKVDAGTLHAHVLDWLQQGHGEPFFIYVQSLDVHNPYDPPAEFRGRVRPVDAEPSAVEKTLADPAASEALRRIVAALKPELYDDCIAYADQEIGNLLAALDRLGVRDRTAVVITADHGESLGEGGRFLHGHSLLEELVRVPLILVLPWDPEPRTIVEPVSLLDVAPTLLDLAGLAVPDTFRGHSMLRERTDPPEHPIVGARLEAAPGPNAHASDWYLRDGPWKLRIDRQNGPHLFDIPADHAESRDVATERPVRAAYLEARLRGLAASTGGSAPPSAPELGDAERRERDRALRALGYVE